MHSPWGIEFSIIKETGWTRRYLLWGEAWANIRLMLADQPRYTGKKKEKAKVVTDIDELNAFFKI